MDYFIKQGTAVTIPMGPFLDSIDGNTEESGLVIQKADVRIKKRGGSFASANADQGASDVGAPYLEKGMYGIDLNTTDTNTVGEMDIIIHKAGALIVRHTYTVLTAQVFDSIILGTDALQIHVVEMTAGIIAAATFAANAIDAAALATSAVNEIQTAIAAGAIAAVTGSVGSVTGNVGGSVGSLGAQAKADVNAEVVDVLKTDTSGEVSAGAPPNAATLETMIRYLYEYFRNNRKTVKTAASAGRVELYADDGTTLKAKADFNDDGTTFTKSEFVAP